MMYRMPADSSLLRHTTIYYPKSLRMLWPDPLAEQWCMQYPSVFDQDDKRLADSQGDLGYHFVEWFSAVHLFQRNGARSMIEKYIYKAHPLKQERYHELLSEQQRKVLDSMWHDDRTQPPDLLVVAGMVSPSHSPK